MDTSVLGGTATGPAHGGGRHHHRDTPVIVATSVVAGAAILAIAALYTNSPEGSAAAAPASDPLLSGTTQTLDGPAQAGLRPLRFRVDLPDGPVMLGQSGQVNVTVANDNAVPIRLEQTTIEVSGTSETGCLAEWFEFGQYSPRRDRAVVVDHGATATITLEYTLRDLEAVNQDACKGAAFTLAVSGRGRPV